jgi:hypothetical protein
MQEGLLNTRAKTHGDYDSMARRAQYLKESFRTSSNWDSLTVGQKEALELIATKIARILSGNPHEADHWRDIAGYARLVEKGLMNHE